MTSLAANTITQAPPAGAPIAAPAAARTKGLSKSFANKRAVDNLDLSVPAGSVYGLLGPNGAGKTTALKMLLGLLKPSSGTVELFGQPWARQQLGRVGALIEQPAIYPHLSGPDNLRTHATLTGTPEKRQAELLDFVGLTAAAGKRAGQYSLGMKQRLGLAIALLGDPELLILDEPTNGLDPVGIREMRDLIRSLPAFGITVIVSSHILAEVSQVATHVGVIADGRFRYQGTLEALLERGHGGLVLESPRPAEALAVARKLALDASLSGEQLRVPVPEEAAAGVIAAIVNAGLPISRLNYEQDGLEALFMQLVGAEVQA